MSGFEAYTKLESWLLFREVLALDAEALSFTRAADFLSNNEHVREDPTFDKARLTPDALHAYFLHLIAVEYGTAPALPSTDDYHGRFDDKIPALVRRLYDEYSQGILVAVREDERRLNELAREIREEEMREEEEKKRKAKAAAASQTPPAVDSPQPVPKPNGRKPSPPQGTQAHQVQAQQVQAQQVQAQQAQAQQAQAQQVQTPPVQTPQAQTRQLPTTQVPAHHAPTPQTQAPVLAPTPAKLTAQPTPQPTSQPQPQPQTQPPAQAQAQAQTAAPPAQAPPAQAPPAQAPPAQAPPAQAPPAQAPPAEVPVAPRPVAASPAPGVVRPPPVVAPPPGAPASSTGPKPPAQPVAAKPPGASAQVLQPPVGVGQPPPRAIQSTSPAPLPAISPRPDPATIAAKPKTPGPVAPPQPSTPGTLKWEKPYQPPVVPSQGRPVPPNISPAPPAAPGAPGQPQHPGQWQPAQQPQQAAQQPQFQPQQHPQQQQQPQAQAPQTPQTAQAHRPTPVLMPPQPPGQLAPPMHAGAGRGMPVAPPQTRPASTTPIPAPVVPAGQGRASPAQQQPLASPTPVYQNRPIAAATSAKPATPVQQAGVAPPPSRRQQQHAGQYTPSQFTPAPAPTTTHTPIQPATADPQRRVGSPYANQPPRPALPPHIASQVPRSPSPAQRPSNVFAPPKTPVAGTPTFIRTGSGTKWKPTSTASTPTVRPSHGDIPSPAFEPLSPVQKPSRLSARPTPATVKKISPKPEKTKPEKVKAEKADKATPSKEAKPGRPRGRPPKIPRDTPKEVAATPLPPRPPPVSAAVVPESTPSRTGPSRRSQSVVSQAAADLSMDDLDELTHHVKDEAATPRPPDETGDTTADESGPSRRHRATPGSMSARLAQKRKRQESPPADLPPLPPLPPASTPTHVLWTRQFGRISSSALDQISSHRCANQFAHPIRERDAPGYKGLVLQPQDIKSIRAAMTHGNRAAGDAAKALPDGDPGTPMVWLPISDDLLPPKSIINSEQLERELVHMFSNAIMYNLDPHRGPGAAFVKRDADADDDAEPSTYLVDEDAVVRDSRTMFLEVERLLGELRNAERKRSGNPPTATTGSGSGTAAAAAGSSAAATPGGTGGGGDSTAAGQLVDDDLDELAGEEGTVATVKRRRIGTRA